MGLPCKIFTKHMLKKVFTTITIPKTIGWTNEKERITKNVQGKKPNDLILGLKICPPSHQIMNMSRCKLNILMLLTTTYRSSRLEVFCQKDVLKNFAKVTGKHLCTGETLAQVFSCEFCEIFTYNFFYKTLVAASWLVIISGLFRGAISFKLLLLFFSIFKHCSTVLTVILCLSL